MAVSVWRGAGEAAAQRLRAGTLPDACSMPLQRHQRCGQAHRAFERGAAHEAGLPLGRAADGALDQLGLQPHAHIK